MKVKICGHRTVEDARQSAKLGADFIGVIVEVPVDTPRKVSRETAVEIIRSIEPPAVGVMVIMPETVEEAVELYEAVRAPYMQLHGDESPKFVEELKSAVPCKIIKTIHVNEDSIKKAQYYEKFANMILLDTATEKAGGSGIAHDWGISSRIVESTEIPVFLAGGLNPENVKEARETVKPYAVDVASGVEGADGGKDVSKVEDFIRGAKGLEF